MTLEMRMPSQPRRAGVWTRILLVFAPGRGRRRVDDRVKRMELAYARQHITLKRVIAERDEARRENTAMTNQLEDALELVLALREHIDKAEHANDMNLHRVRVEATMPSPESEWPTQPMRRVRGVLAPTAVQTGNERTCPEIDMTEVLQAGRHAASRLHVNSATYAENADLGNPVHLANATPYRS